MSISGRTKVYGIFGHPVSHSFSPRMHNAAFTALGLDCVYIPFDIEPRDLETATKALRAMSIAGVNVTIPHKEAVMGFLDEISPDAGFTGAVNTVLNSDGRLLGFNTDVRGFLRALGEDLGFEPKGRVITVIGAGGAARAVLSGLCMRGVKRVNIVNRTHDKAIELAEEFGGSFAETEFRSAPLSDTLGLRGYLSETDLLVNASSLGMEGAPALDLSLDTLKEGACVYDLVYNPLETALVKEAKGLGRRAAGGINMLVFQGAESIKIWTGEDPPIDVMRSAVV